MSNTAHQDLHDLVDALPPGEEQAAGRCMEYLRDAGDPFASMDRIDPLQRLTVDERTRLQASLRRAEDEIAAGQSLPAEDLLRKLRAAR